MLRQQNRSQSSHADGTDRSPDSFHELPLRNTQIFLTLNAGTSFTASGTLNLQELGMGHALDSQPAEKVHPDGWNMFQTERSRRESFLARIVAV